MPLSKEANNRIWNALMKEALIDSCNKELLEIKKEMEKEKDLTIFSKKFENSIKTLANSIGRKNIIKISLKVSLKIFVSMSVILAISFGALLTQPEVYAAVGGVMKKIFNTHDSYVYDGHADTFFDDSKRLGYVPADFELRSVFYADNIVKITYENPTDGSSIKFNYGFTDNYQISIDNERHKYDEISYNNIIYNYYEADEKEDWNILHWNDGNYFYSIYAQLSREEIVKIAKNIKNGNVL